MGHWQGHRIALIGLLVVVLTGAAKPTVPLEKRQWSRITSDNFRVHSVLGETRTIELLRWLEVMRSAFSDPNALATFQAAVPTVILAVDNEADYRFIGAPGTTIGIFVADTRENAIVIQDHSDVLGVRTILHEYVHYLLRQSGRIVYPKWYEEGTAEYLSSSQVRDDSFEYGLALRDRLKTLKVASWMPLRAFLDLSDLSHLDSSEGDLYYSQAWLLVHYLNSLPDAELNLPLKVRRYGELRAAGDDPVQAFEKSFEITVDELENALKKYFRAGKFGSRKVPVDTSMPGFNPRVETLRQAQAEVALGRMAIRFDNDEAAESWFNSALADEEMRPSAEAGLGIIYGRRGEVAKAEARFDAAVYLVSYDFRLWMDYAQFWAERVYQSVDRDKTEFYASRLEESLRNALTISGATPELNTLMGLAYLAQGKDVDEAIEYLEAAGEQSPTDQVSRMLLASAYLYDRQARRAIDVAESILSIEHERNQTTVSAQDIISQARELLEAERR